MTKFYDALTEFIFVENAPTHGDVIFLPGGSYGEIAQRAAQLFHQGYAPCILVSGKHSILETGFSGPASPPEYQGKKYDRECDFLSDVLQREGVPKEAILLEGDATFTYENAIFSRKLLKKQGMEIGSALLCCQAYHARRCLMYYQLLFPQTIFHVCPAITRNTGRQNWQNHPESIDLVLGEVERCGSQFHQIMKDLKAQV